MEYIGTYKVYKIFRKSNRKQILERGLTREEAKRIVNSYPDNNTSMVVFDKQFTADKYYKEVPKENEFITLENEQRAFDDTLAERNCLENR